MTQRTCPIFAETLYSVTKLNGKFPSNLVIDTTSSHGDIAMKIIPHLTDTQLNKLSEEIKKKEDNEVSLLFYRVTEGSSELPKEITSFDINELDNVKEYRFNGNTEPLLIRDYCNTTPPLKDSIVYEHYVAVTLVMKA